MKVNIFIKLLKEYVDILSTVGFLETDIFDWLITLTLKGYESLGWLKISISSQIISAIPS